MIAYTVHTVVMLGLVFATFFAILHPKVETGFWVTLGLAGVCTGSLAALDPDADLGKVALLMALGNLLVTVGIVTRTVRANKNCRLSGWGRRATDDAICGGWSTDNSVQGAGSPPANET